MRKNSYLLMFIRIKTTPNSPRKSIQIVESIRKENGKVQQKILRHVGIAENEFELQKLQELAEYIKCQIEEERDFFLLITIFLIPRSALLLSRGREG